MNPDAAADLLADLPEEGRGTILGRMALKERLEISHLLEFGERTAAGRMTTEFFAVPETATVGETTASMRGYEGALETLATVYLTGPDRDLRASVPLARLIVATPETPVRSLASSPLVFCPADASDRDIVELFDKYNLLTLPVVDEHHRLSGVITADDVICLLHHRH